MAGQRWVNIPIAFEVGSSIAARDFFYLSQFYQAKLFGVAAGCIYINYNGIIPKNCYRTEFVVTNLLRIKL
jgi:hypothetical protein